MSRRQELERRRRQLRADIKEETALGAGMDLPRLSDLRSQLEVIDQELVAIREQQDQLLLASDTLTVSDLVDRYCLAYLSDDHKFSITWNTSTNPNSVNVISKTVQADRIINSLNSLLPAQQKLQRMTAGDIIAYCQENNRAFLTMTSSFNTRKWARGCYNQLQDLRRFWVELNDDEVDPRFADLMFCLGGGKQENIDHLEQWVAYKYMCPEETVNIPHINISGIPGENGKGLFKILLKTIFTAGSVVNATTKELINGFNAKWKDAVVLIYEEMNERELPENKIKSVTGDPELSVELKGRDAFMVDANYSILFFDNNVQGTVRLSGSGPNGEDRRYSVIETNISLPRYIESVYGVSSDEAKLRCQGTAELLHDTRAVGAWLRSVIQRHQVLSMTAPPKLHGADYWNRVKNQETDWDGVVRDLALCVQRAGAIPVKLLVEQARRRLGEETRVVSQRLAQSVIAELRRMGMAPHKIRARRVNTPWHPDRATHNNIAVITVADHRDGAVCTIDTNPWRDTDTDTDQDQREPLWHYDES